MDKWAYEKKIMWEKERKKENCEINVSFWVYLKWIVIFRQTCITEAHHDLLHVCIVQVAVAASEVSHGARRTHDEMEIKLV